MGTQRDGLTHVGAANTSRKTKKMGLHIALILHTSKHMKSRNISEETISTVTSKSATPGAALH